MPNREKFRARIAARHGRPIAAGIAKLATKYLNAYNNVGNWDMAVNGELRIIRLALNNLEGEVFDVGANSGQWAQTVSPHLGGKRLHSFEPIPDIFSRLEEALGHRRNIVLNNAALGSFDGTVDINYSSTTDTISSQFPLIYDLADQRVVTCKVMKGDTYIAQNSIERISLLKIDVEGMEAETLAGFEQCFAAGRIGCVQFEHGPSHVHSGHTLKYFMDYFAERGFTVYAVYPHAHLPVDYSPATEDFAGRNYLAIHKSAQTDFARGAK